MSGKVRTVSVSKGNGYIPHNVRAFTPANADPDRTSMNRTYVHEDLKSAYEKLFGDAIRVYDQKQKRTDRKIGSSDAYLSRMRGKDGEGSKNGEQPFHEIIVQVGDMHDCGCGTPDGELAAEILDEYARDFQSRNPRLHVIGMYMHLDEATPHLHVDFIPVAKEYKTGMSVRNGLDRALKQQGISAGKDNRKSNATIAWQDQERDALEKIMKAHGITRAEHSGSDRKGLPIDQYRAMAESLEHRIEQQPMPKARKTLGGGVKLSEAEWSDVAFMHKLSQQLAESSHEALAAANRKIKEASYLRSTANRALERSADTENQAAVLKSELEAAKDENASLSESLTDMRAVSSGALISAQYVYLAMTEIMKMFDPGDDFSRAVMSSVVEELSVVLNTLGGHPDVPQYGALSPLAASIAENLISAGASVRFDNLSPSGTASVIAEMPGSSQSIVLASDIPDFRTAKQLLGQVPVSRNVRTRKEYLADARAVVTPLLQAMSLGSDAPREQIRDMMESVGVIPVIDRDDRQDLWNILMPRSFSLKLQQHNVQGEEVSEDRLADFWLPRYADAVQKLDQTAQARAKERKKKQAQTKPVQTRGSHDGWSR